MQTRSHCLSRMRIALGTFVAIEAQAPSRESAERGLTTAFEAIATVDRLMHPSRAGSDLARLARISPGAALEVHAWTWDVLDLSRQINERSRGAFDPCLGTAPGRLTDVDLSRPGRVLVRTPVHVDLGGIAKGFAVDRALDALRTSGCDGGMVNAGGDLAVFGVSSREIVRLNAEGGSCLIELCNAALAASDTGRADRPLEHRGYYHGTDRRRTVAGSATVMAPSAAVADALTKCVLLERLDRSLLAAFGARDFHFAPKA